MKNSIFLLSKGVIRSVSSGSALQRLGILPVSAFVFHVPSTIPQMISVPQLHLEFFWDYLHYSHLAFYVLGKVDLCPFFVCWVKKMQGITEILFTQSIFG